MRTLLTVILLATLAGTAFAQFPGSNLIGVFFSDTEFTQETTNFDTDAAPFFSYLVLVNGTTNSVGGYECSVAYSDPTVFVLGVTGANGWTNFGDNGNHLVGFQTPLPVQLPGTVLATFNLLYSGVDRVEISLGPAIPASIPDEMAIADGDDPENLIGCPCLTDDCVVATLNGEGVVATENQSWTGVKALFD